jgi:DNA-binding LacI/PurR family transcriptional regulator
MRNLLDKNVDAIFAASDSMALGAIKAIQDAGLRVPDDIAVVGFEDAPFAVDTSPPLTTVRQPTDKLGSYAVEMLVELIESSDGSSRRMILPAELVIRASS